MYRTVMVRPQPKALVIASVFARTVLCPSRSVNLDLRHMGSLFTPSHLQRLRNVMISALQHTEILNAGERGNSLSLLQSVSVF